MVLLVLARSIQLPHLHRRPEEDFLVRNFHFLPSFIKYFASVSIWWTVLALIYHLIAFMHLLFDMSYDFGLLCCSRLFVTSSASTIRKDHSR